MAANSERSPPYLVRVRNTASPPRSLVAAFESRRCGVRSTDVLIRSSVRSHIPVTSSFFFFFAAGSELYRTQDLAFFVRLSISRRRRRYADLIQFYQLSSIEFDLLCSGRRLWIVGVRQQQSPLNQWRVIY